MTALIDTILQRLQWRLEEGEATNLPNLSSKFHINLEPIIVLVTKWNFVIGCAFERTLIQDIIQVQRQIICRSNT